MQLYFKNGKINIAQITLADFFFVHFTAQERNETDEYTNYLLVTL